MRWKNREKQDSLEDHELIKYLVFIPLPYVMDCSSIAGCGNSLNSFLLYRGMAALELLATCSLASLKGLASRLMTGRLKPVNLSEAIRQ